MKTTRICSRVAMLSLAISIGCGGDREPRLAETAERLTTPVVITPTAQVGRGGSGVGGGGFMAAKPEARLHTLLGVLSSAVGIRAKARAVRQIRSELGFLESALFDCLADVETRYTAPALEAAARLGLTEIALPIRRFAASGSVEVRVAAIRAGTTVRLWQSEQLAELLKAEESEVLVAALKAANLVVNPPSSAIVALLDHPDRVVREAVIATFPAELDGAAWLVIDDIFSSDTARTRRIATQAIGVADPSAPRTARLMKAIDDADWSVRFAALRAIRSTRTPLPELAPLWRAVDDQATDVAVRLAAWQVLEISPQTDPAAIQRRFLKLGVRERVAAARCLVASGSLDGLRRLVAIRLSPETDGDRDEDSSRARAEAIDVLGELAPTDLGNSPELWDAWISSLNSVPNTAITTPARVF